MSFSPIEMNLQICESDRQPTPGTCFQLAEPLSTSSAAEYVDLVISAAEFGAAIDPGAAARLVRNETIATVTRLASTYSQSLASRFKASITIVPALIECIRMTCTNFQKNIYQNLSD